MRTELATAVIVKCGLTDPRNGRTMLLAGSIGKSFLDISVRRAASLAPGRLRWRWNALVKAPSPGTWALRRSTNLPSPQAGSASLPLPSRSFSSLLSWPVASWLERGSSAHSSYIAPPSCPTPWQGPEVAGAGATADGINASAAGPTGQGHGGAATSAADGSARAVDRSSAGSRVRAFAAVALRGSSRSTCLKVRAH